MRRDFPSSNTVFGPPPKQVLLDLVGYWKSERVWVTFPVPTGSGGRTGELSCVISPGTRTVLWMPEFRGDSSICGQSRFGERETRLPSVDKIPLSWGTEKPEKLEFSIIPNILPPKKEPAGISEE